MPGPCLDEFRRRALRMLSEARPDHKTDHAAIKHVAGKLGVNPETLRYGGSASMSMRVASRGPPVRRRRRSSG